MSGVMATTASGTSAGGAAVPRSWGTPAVRAAIIGTGAVGLALRLWILILPGLMSITQFDDGPYFGSAVRLVDGVSRVIEWPACEFHHARVKGRDVVLFVGAEPNVRWRTFATAIVDMAHGLGVRVVVGPAI